MCVDFYTLDVRNLGQAEGAHKVGASARTSQKTTETLAFRVERVSANGVPENPWIFGESEATHILLIIIFLSSGGTSETVTALKRYSIPLCARSSVFA